MSPVLPIEVSDGLFLDPATARKAGEALSEFHCFAEPFPHTVVDNFLPDSVARLALEHFPKEAMNSDRVFDMGYAGLHKRQILPEECDASVRQLFHFFNSQPMLEFLEGVTAIQGLIPDPYFNGGGVHETSTGGKLGSASTPTFVSTSNSTFNADSTSSSISTKHGTRHGTVLSSCGTET